MCTKIHPPKNAKQRQPCHNKTKLPHKPSQQQAQLRGKRTPHPAQTARDHEVYKRSTGSQERGDDCKAPFGVQGVAGLLVMDICAVQTDYDQGGDELNDSDDCY